MNKDICNYTTYEFLASRGNYLMDKKKTGILDEFEKREYEFLGYIIVQKNFAELRKMMIDMIPDEIKERL
jgi:uncharacterized protein YnzC (UPF0291/DUF896 family)